MLQPFAEDVWLLHRPLRFWGVETGTRMTVVRLADGGLFVHSPVALDAATKAAVDALGPVTAVVAPSRFHHLFVGEWLRAYPDATAFACPGLETKRPDLSWKGVLGDQPEAPWRSDLDQVFFGARWLENEVVFFHEKSRTLICADLIFNLAQHSSRMTRLAALLLGNRGPGATWLEHVIIRDRRAARAQVDRMLAWRPERIALAHGAVVEHDGADVVRRAYAWL
ncbi:MAG: DUF4336 domain-containing protein [Deltaproteobacteria bacterium]|nr:DUF4336 domain-containing protein [Deltaproteobacteria bacterium]